MARIDRLVAVRLMCVTGEARQIRLAAGLSLEDIAQAVDPANPPAPTSVYRWERGLRNPRGDRALRYLAVLERLRTALAVHVPDAAS